MGLGSKAQREREVSLTLIYSQCMKNVWPFRLLDARERVLLSRLTRRQTTDLSVRGPDSGSASNLISHFTRYTAACVGVCKNFITQGQQWQILQLSALLLITHRQFVFFSFGHQTDFTDTILRLVQTNTKRLDLAHSSQKYHRTATHDSVIIT